MKHVCYAGEPIPQSFSKSLYLAGPTPRDPEVPSWRTEALSVLGRLGYDGVVYVPEDRDGGRWLDLEHQERWEAEAMNCSDQVVFFIPRDLKTLPGLTTNHEFGALSTRDPLRVVLGTPPFGEADRVRYQHLQAANLHVPAFFDLKETLACALARIGDGAERTAGERMIPLHIYRTPSFQNWSRTMRAAGNRLEEAFLEWTLRPGNRRDQVLFWIAWTRIWVEAEKRYKTEKVIARPDLCAVLAYCPGPTMGKTRVALVREFRAPVTNRAGAVLELPSGSSAVQTPMLNVAASELREEVGLDLPLERFRFVEARQVSAPFSVHLAHLFGVELSSQEMDDVAAKERLGYAFGDGQGDEQIQVVVREVGDLLTGSEKDPPVDWQTLGLVCRGLHFLTGQRL